MKAARGVRAGVFYSTVFGVTALFAVAAQAADQCTAAKAEVELADQLTTNKRAAHFSLLRTIFSDAQAGDLRVKFLDHLKGLNDFRNTLDAIDKEANAGAGSKELKIDKLLGAIDKAVKAGNDLEVARRSKDSKADDSSISAASQVYVKALDELYVECVSILTPVGGEDLYKEAEAYIEAQKNKYKAFASKYEALQSFETAAPRVTGTGAIRGLDTLKEFLGKPVGLFVAAMGREPTKPVPLNCDEWFKKKTDKDTRPSETAQILICAQLKLEDAKAKLKAINPPCEPPKPTHQAGVGVRIDSVVYGQLRAFKVEPKEADAASKEVKPVEYRLLYGRNEHCDATNYFREQCEMVAFNARYCIVKATGKLGTDTDCKADTDIIVRDVVEFLPRSETKVRKICRVDIDPRRMCGSYIPAEDSPARTATIRYRCSDDQTAKVWQVYPLKRDKELAYLYCPDEDRPSEYHEAPMGPIPVK